MDPYLRYASEEVARQGAGLQTSLLFGKLPNNDVGSRSADEGRITDSAAKQLRKCPRYIQESLQVWVETVRRLGIRETRTLPGYHDEPLKGQRRGQRSVRLNRAYRAIYKETIEGLVLVVIEVNKHEY